MKNFLIGEDELSYHVHDGKKNFLVAKKGIKDDLHAKIKSLPKYAEGGVVEEEVQREPASGGLASMLPDFMFEGGKNPWVGTPSDQVGLPAESTAGPAPASIESPVVAEPTVVPEVQPQAVTPQAPKGPDFYGQLKANNAMQAGAIKETANIQSQLAQQEADVYKQAEMPEFEATLKARMQELEQERVKVKQEIDAFRTAGAEDKIDPNRVWNNMGTGNKILATIGLILGGAGSGGQASNNAALNVLNNAIDRDIKAQAANIDKKTSLYKTNLDRYKDATTAQEMTRMQLNSMTQGKIAGLAARSKSESAKAQAMLMIGQLNNQNLELGQKLYERQAVRTASGVHPLAAKIQSLPENVRTAAWKELGDYENLKNNIGEVDRVMDEFGEIGAIDRMNPFTSDKVAQKKTALVGIAKSLLGEAMQEADVKRMVDPFVPGIISNNKAARDAAKKELKKVIMGKVAGKTPILTQFGVIPKQMAPAELGMKKRGQ